MELNEFIENVADVFEDTDPSVITADCHFRELDEYDSLVGMGLIAMSMTQYQKAITGSDIRSCTTVEDLYHLIEGK